MIDNLVGEDAAIAKIAAEHRLLAILKVLDRLPGYASNQDVLRDCLERLGHAAARDVLLKDFESLERLGLVRLRWEERLAVVVPTGRGQDVGAGRAVVEGVARPSPD